MTILEIAVPVLLFVILAVIRGQIDPPLYKEIITKNLETYQVKLDHQNFLEIFIQLKNFPRPTIWCQKCLWIVGYETIQRSKAPQTSSSVEFLP